MDYYKVVKAAGIIGGSYIIGTSIGLLFAESIGRLFFVSLEPRGGMFYGLASGMYGFLFVFAVSSGIITPLLFHKAHFFGSLRFSMIGSVIITVCSSYLAVKFGWNSVFQIASISMVFISTGLYFMRKGELNTHDHAPVSAEAQKLTKHIHIISVIFILSLLLPLATIFIRGEPPFWSTGFFVAIGLFGILYAILLYLLRNGNYRVFRLVFIVWCFFLVYVLYYHLMRLG